MVVCFGEIFSGWRVSGNYSSVGSLRQMVHARSDESRGGVRRSSRWGKGSARGGYQGCSGDVRCYCRRGKGSVRGATGEVEAMSVVSHGVTEAASGMVSNGKRHCQRQVAYR